jgi:hypothetical protein
MLRVRSLCVRVVRSSLSFPVSAKALAFRFSSRTPVAARQNMNSDQRIPPPIHVRKDSPQNFSKNRFSLNRSPTLCERNAIPGGHANPAGTVWPEKRESSFPIKSNAPESPATRRGECPPL